jgi:AraC-like DNA-binding protein
MPRTVTSTFSEPEDFAAALRKGGCLSLLITGHGQFQAQLIRVTLHRLRLSAAEERLSRIAFVAVPADMVITAFPIGYGSVPSRDKGGAHQGEVMILPPGGYVHVRAEGLRRWGTVWIPLKELVRYCGAVTGTSLMLPSVAQRWRPPPAAGRRLRSLHAAAMRMVANRPQALVNAEAAHGLEQQLIHALVECLSAGSGDESTLIERRHQDIMVRFEHLLRAQPDRDMPMTEICAELDVSPRLLGSLCAEHLGMSPTAYDRLRRMTLVRRIFLRGDRDAASIAEIAWRYGFRDPGRFAVNYRTAFGELPSATVRRRAEQ